MGGCRCTFQTCENNSANSPDLHFFHYPAKKPELCRKWAKYANRMEFMSLPLDKLKNKVVCQAHFRSGCFMNYLQCSLVKTGYPTLMKYGEIVIDLEKDTQEEREAKLNMVPGKVVAPIVPEETAEEPPQETFIIDMLPPSVEDIGGSILIEQSSNQQNFVYELSSLMDTTTTTTTTTSSSSNKQSSVSSKKNAIVKEPTILNAVYKRSKPAQSPGCVVKKSPRKTIILSDMRINPVAGFEKKLKQEAMRPDTTETVEIVPEPVKMDVIEAVADPQKDAALDNMAKEIGELKQMVLETVNTLKAQASTSQVQKASVAPVKETICKPDKSMTKQQIFKSIKRYVSPAMVALLRMEMFGGMDREWKDDEKEVAVDLLNLGPNVYNFIKEEWRFRLPPEKMVKEWSGES